MESKFLLKYIRNHGDSACTSSNLSIQRSHNYWSSSVSLDTSLAKMYVFNSCTRNSVVFSQSNIITGRSIILKLFIRCLLLALICCRDFLFWHFYYLLVSVNDLKLILNLKKFGGGFNLVNFQCFFKGSLWSNFLTF